MIRPQERHLFLRHVWASMWKSKRENQLNKEREGKREREKKKRRLFLCGIKLNGSFETLFSLSHSFTLLQVVPTIFPRQIKKPWPFSLSLYVPHVRMTASLTINYIRGLRTPFLPLSIALVTGKDVVNSDSIGQVQPVGDHAPLR